MKEEARVEMSLENRFKEALRKAKEVREYIKERNDTREPDVAECLAYDMRYVEEYVRQLEEENKRLNNHNIIGRIDAIKIEDLEPVLKPYYIPKSKVKEKIEELDNSNGYSPVNKILIEQALQELLEREGK